MMMGRTRARFRRIALLTVIASVGSALGGLAVGEESSDQSLRSLIATQGIGNPQPGSESQLPDARPGLPVQESDGGPAGQSIFGDRSQRVPRVAEGRFQLPPLMAATTETKNIGNGRLPEGFREDTAAPLEPLAESGAERGLGSTWVAGEWAAPNTFANPRYFEDRMLERHGHQRWGHLQPLAAGARFFATVPMLPYLMTVKPPCETEYSLGHFRAGSRAPGLLQRPPYERRAAIVEGAAIAGGIIAFP